jgi:hypothetical protein
VNGAGRHRAGPSSAGRLAQGWGWAAGRTHTFANSMDGYRLKPQHFCGLELYATPPLTHLISFPSLARGEARRSDEPLTNHSLMLGRRLMWWQPEPDHTDGRT